MDTAHFAKGGSLRLLLFLLLLCSARAAHAQRLSSLGVGAGAALQDDARATAAFTVSAGIDWGIPWTALLQRSVAELEGNAEGGTLHDVSFALLPSWEPSRGRLVLAAGPSLHAVGHDFVDRPDESGVRIAATGLAGLRLPVAGDGVVLELLARSDVMDPVPQFSALFGMRIRLGVANTLAFGEPRAPAQVAARRAIWNDVLMQLILLQQSLESFTRIKEVETGIELEFDQRPITLYDDIARAARVLAAADPPVMVTVFAPNAGRVGAAVTAGAFPAERLRLQRDSRVYLRVEH